VLKLIKEKERSKFSQRNDVLRTMAEESFNRDIRVTKLLKASYSRWKIEIRDALESHRIWEIASGNVSKPQEINISDGSVTNRKEIEEWKAKDSKARSIIRSTLDNTKDSSEMRGDIRIQ